MINQRYKIIAKIGEGGFAKVFLAQDTKMDILIALKRYDPDKLIAKIKSQSTGAKVDAEKYSVLSEIKRGIGLTHNNLIRYYDAFDYTEQSSFGEEKYEVGIMEYLKDGDWGDFLEKYKPDSPEFKNAFKGVLEGLYFSIKSYELYLKTNPLGDFKILALYRLDSIYQNEAVQLANQLEELNWNNTLQINSNLSYKNYLEKYPDGKFKEIASFKIDSIKTKIKNEDDDWLIAKTNNSIESYDYFFKKYPVNKYTNQAQIKLKQLIINENYSKDKSKLQNEESSLKIKSENISNSEIDNTNAHNTANHETENRNNLNKQTQDEVNFQKNTRKVKQESKEEKAYQKILNKRNINDMQKFIQEYPKSIYFDSLNILMKEVLDEYNEVSQENRNTRKIG